MPSCSKYGYKYTDGVDLTIKTTGAFRRIGKEIYKPILI